MEIVQKDVNKADLVSAITFWRTLNAFYDMEKWDVLDAFARNGQLTVRNYVQWVNSVEAWELSAEHREELLGMTNNVLIGDSYARLIQTLDEPPRPQYDMIVIDTPAGIHTDSLGSEHSEHFDFMKRSLPLLKSGGVFVLYVNKRPYNPKKVGFLGYDKYKEFNWTQWMNDRKTFYGQKEISEWKALQKYEFHLKAYDREVTNAIVVPCTVEAPLTPHCFRVALEVK